MAGQLKLGQEPPEQDASLVRETLEERLGLLDRTRANLSTLASTAKLIMWDLLRAYLAGKRASIAGGSFQQGFLVAASNNAIWFLARPYVSGVGIDTVFERARENQDKYGLLATLDTLGEGFVVDETNGELSVMQELQTKIRLAVELYKSMIDRVVQGVEAGYFSSDDRKKPTISLKPSNFGMAARGSNGDINLTDKTKDEIYQRMKNIIQYAKDRGVNVSIDMEDHNWTEFTVDIYIRLVKVDDLTNVGIVLQTRMHRTQDDLVRILNELGQEARIRIVIGIYQEPEEYAISDKPEMKTRMVEYAKRMFENCAYVEFATHDQDTVRELLQVVSDRGVDNSQFELQMLEGVPMKNFQTDLIGNGINFRLYIPFTVDKDFAVSYCRRRLIKNRDMFEAGFNHALSIIAEAMGGMRQDYARAYMKGRR